MPLTKQLKDWLVQNDFAVATSSDDVFRDAVKEAIRDGKLTVERLAELSAPSAKDAFGGIRVKRPGERYSSEKSIGKHFRTGLPVNGPNGKQVEVASEKEAATIGSFFKRVAQKGGCQIQLSDHDKCLLQDSFDHDEWVHSPDSADAPKYISGMQAKALLDDATSGGFEAVPVAFDESLITFPLLHSELLPMVDLREIGARRVEAASIGNPTLVSGTAEGTALTPFDTSGLVAAIDSTIHPVTCAIEIGRDFLADSPADVGRQLTENMGQRMAEWLDNQIANGDGTTEPQGIFNATGLTDIGNPAGGAGAAPQVVDFESLLFGVPKQYRAKFRNPCFFADDTSYQRARSIAVGTADERRVFGMDHESYSLLNHPFKVQNDIGNNFAAFGSLKAYRLWRRLGQQISFTTEGRELTLKNLGLLVVRARYGGRVVDGAAFAFSDNWQA